MPARLAGWGHAFSFLGVQERKRLAKERRRTRETPVFPLRILSLQRGCGPSDSLGFLFFRLYEKESAYEFCERSLSVLLLRLRLICLQRSWCRAADFWSFPAKSKFPLEISLRGGFQWSRETFLTPLQVPRKDFCRAKVPCGGRDSKFAARQIDSRIPFQTGKPSQTTTRVLTIFASTLD